MKPTLEDLKRKKTKANKKQERIKLAISLNICPVCGAPIIIQYWEQYDKPRHFLWWKINGHKWDDRRICSVDKSHYENCWDIDCLE